MSRIFKICKIFRMSFHPNRRAGACLPRQDFRDVQNPAGFFRCPSRIGRSCATERGGDRGDPPPQASVVRDRLIANMSVPMLSVISTVARDRPSPYGRKACGGSLSRGGLSPAAGFSGCPKSRIFCRCPSRIGRSCSTEWGGPCSSRSPDCEHVSLDAFGETDVGEGQALALR